MSIINFLNSKGKPFVVFLSSLISIGLFIISTLFANLICQEWYGLIVGIILMILAIPFHILGKKNKIGYLISVLLNSIGCGFSTSAYYIEYDVSVNLYNMIISAVPAAAVLLLVYLMLQIFCKTKKVTVSIAVAVNIIMLISSVVFWIINSAEFFSFCFFCLLISLFYLCVFGITINHDERSALRDISFGSFGSFIILTIVVIVIISEGDIFDGFDFSGGGGNKKRKKKL